MYVYMYVCMHIYLHVYVCMYVCMHICMHACMCVCMHTCLHVCVHTCMNEFMHICTHVCMHVCKYRISRWVSWKRLELSITLLADPDIAEPKWQKAFSKPLTLNLLSFSLNLEALCPTIIIVSALNIHAHPSHIEQVLRLPGAVSPVVLHNASL